MRIWNWFATGALTVMLLGGYIATAPVIDAPIHLYAAIIVMVAVTASALNCGVVPGAILVLLATFIPGFISTPMGLESSSKRIELLATALAVLAGYYLLRNGAAQRAWIASLAALSLTTIGLAILYPLNSWRLAVDGTSYIGSGRLIALGATLAGVLLVLGRGPRYLTIPAVLALSYASFLTGSRGPLAAGICTIVAVGMFRRGLNFSRVSLAMGGIAALGALTVSLLPEDSFGANRILGFTEEDSSAQERLQLFATAVKIGASHPGGIGWGNFATYPGTISDYPHNIFLEVFAEGGWFAGAAILAFVSIGLRRLWQNSHEPTGAALFGIAIFFTLNAMVSANINGNRAMFAVLAFAWTLGATASDGETQTPNKSGPDLVEGDNPETGAYKRSTLGPPKQNPSHGNMRM